jgi:hypothetical protein
MHSRHSHKKFRGIKRYLRKWANTVTQLKNENAPNSYEYEYWNLKIPIHQSLLHQSNKLTKKILNEFICSAESIFSKSSTSSRIDTIVLSHPEYFASEICSFFSESSFNEFISRNTTSQKWVPQENGIVELFNLSIPESIKSINFIETINDEIVYQGTVTLLVRS